MREHASWAALGAAWGIMGLAVYLAILGALMIGCGDDQIDGRLRVDAGVWQTQWAPPAPVALERTRVKELDAGVADGGQ